MIYGVEYFTDKALVKGVWDIVLNQVLPIFLVIWFWRRFSATPGKILLKMEIRDAKTLGDISIQQTVIRYIGYIVSLLPLCLGFIWIGFDKKKQSWHDKLAGTVVIKTR